MRLFFVLVLTALAASGSAHSAFNNKSFSAAYHYPDLGSPYSGAAFSSESFAVGAGVETIGSVEGVTGFLVDVSDSALTITFDTVLDHPTWALQPFNGLVLTLESPGTLQIASHAIGPGTSLDGFDPSRVSFSDAAITLNWGGLAYRDGQQVVVDFTFSSQHQPGQLSPAVPETGSLAFLIAGMIAVIFLRRLRPGVVSPSDLRPW